MRFFTSDTHFGHFNVIKYCDRPFTDRYKMDYAMITRWNNIVKPEDTVYHLGDVSFYGREETGKIVQRLNGHKIIIRGNHDKGLQRLKEYGFEEAYESLQLTLNNGIDVNLSHYPYYEHYAQHLNDASNKAKHLSKNLKDDGNWLLCGHVHEKWRNIKKMINVGVDVWDFTPVSEESVMKYIKEIEHDNV